MTNDESLFSQLRDGLSECVSHERGQRKLRSLEIPDEPPEIDAANLMALRLSADLSPAVFAGILNVSTGTLRNWEQGRRKPSAAVRRLIHLFSQRPAEFCEVIGLRQIALPKIRIVQTARGTRQIVVGSQSGRRHVAP